jgi:hypothetical protein
VTACTESRLLSRVHTISVRLLSHLPACMRVRGASLDIQHKAMLLCIAVVSLFICSSDHDLWLCGCI